MWNREVLGENPRQYLRNCDRACSDRLSTRAARVYHGRLATLVGRVAYGSGSRCRSVRRRKLAYGSDRQPPAPRRILLPPEVSRNLLEAKFPATSSVVGDVHRSTPCRVRMDRAVTSFRHAPCLDAHDVPLRGWRTNAFRILAATPLA